MGREPPRRRGVVRSRKVELGTFQWLVGIAFGAMTFGVGAVTKALYRLADEMRAGNREAHSRINEVRKEYVRRDDLDKHLSTIEKKIDTMAAE